MLFGFTHGGNDQHHGRHQEGQHLVKGAGQQILGDVHIQHAEAAEHDGTQDSLGRAPAGENHQGYRDPALAVDGAVIPNAAAVDQGDVGAAKAADAASGQKCSRTSSGIH